MVLQNSMSQAFKDSNCEVEAMFIFSDLLQVLALNEFLELIVPICYLFCFLVAFYGHNSHHIGPMIQILYREDVNLTECVDPTPYITIIYDYIYCII